ncbi:MAG TPA: Glu/Leu/Phe/Val dehydrogenase dimerization domain-containing protein [Thermoanaerobaculia bacterium]|nr:Glu/Leu/Phe/Val dehydrogenase dimerization domain-containing protein [Thermoanaerobaculia bacterium]
MSSGTSGWEGEALLERRDAKTGALMLVAIHSSRLGPATGGTRLKTYPSEDLARRDARRLAEAMTYKWAAADFPRGGGKAVLAVPDGFGGAAREGLLRRYGAFLRELSGRFATGPDVGTSPADMDVIAETGAPYVFSRTPARGGAGGSGPWTALGVFAAIEAVGERLFGDRSPRGRRVVVQGAGSVGGPLIERLLEAEARVAVGDPSPEAMGRFRGVSGVELLAPETCLEAEADVLAPCALGGVLDAAMIPRLRCRAVVGAANDQLAEPADAGRLRARGILYAPDFVVNAGGAVAITGIEALGWTPARAEAAVRAIGGTLQRVLALADRNGLTTDGAARRLAEERLAAAQPRR